MQALYKTVTEDNKELEIKFQIIKNENSPDGRQYGILATVISNGIAIENERVENKFFTYEETEKIIDMLCRYQVTPCTLKDVL